MARSMIGGIITSNLVTSNNVIASNTSYERLEPVKNQYGIITTTNNKEVAQYADIIFLSIKPNKYEIVMGEIKDYIKDDVIIISIAPGIEIKTIEAGFGKKMKVIRSMPNTPALVGEGMSAICSNDMVSSEELGMVIKIFESFGKAEIIDEKLMDVIPAISGSSPAYAYMFIEAMAEGGVLRGLPWNKAYKLAAQSVLGAAKMILETGEHPAELRDKVCSPGGTTIAAVRSLELNGFKGTVIEAMEECTKRVIEMSKGE